MGEHPGALPAHKEGGFWCHPHLTDEETEAQRGEGIWPQVHSLPRIFSQAYRMPGSKAWHTDMGPEEAPRDRPCNRRAYG